MGRLGFRVAVWDLLLTDDSGVYGNSLTTCFSLRIKKGKEYVFKLEIFVRLSTTAQM